MNIKHIRSRVRKQFPVKGIEGVSVQVRRSVTAGEVVEVQRYEPFTVEEADAIRRILDGCGCVEAITRSPFEYGFASASVRGVAA